MIANREIQRSRTRSRGKTKDEALHALKRRESDAVYRQLVAAALRDIWRSERHRLGSVGGFSFRNRAAARLSSA
jgi:hypothetical protein